MQLFAVTIERTVRRKLTIAANNPDLATKIAANTLPAGHRIISTTAIDTETMAGIPAEDLGYEALDHILQQLWLPREGHAWRISDWLAMAMVDADDLKTANKSLAVAGLRVSDGWNVPHLLIASPFSHPQIAEWTRGRDFGGGIFLPALAALNGAYRPKTGYTFAGITSRVVAIPMQTVMDSTVTPTP